MTGEADRLDDCIAVVGSGVGGLVTALALAPLPVVLITRAEIGKETSSAWAQGGVAASLGADDSAELHVADTLAAGAGLCDPLATASILSATRQTIDFLESHGVHFDRNDDGSLAFGLEAAHSRKRIIHVHGDGTGAALVAALGQAVEQAPSITVLSGTEVRRLIVRDNRLCGLICDRAGEAFTLATSRALLATGGLGGLYETSTNPSGNFGQGIMLAARAGAMLADMEFVQFHPTALACDIRPLPLISEAVRGEGAILVNDDGERFLAATPGRELAPRDVVARAIASEIASGKRVFLDAGKTIGKRFARRFPAIDAICRNAGIDPEHDLIPVQPAEHYHMGGIATDLAGRTSLSGLWAAGECASTGLHGANRLASNSLLEAAIMGLKAADSIRAASSAGQNLAPPMPLPPKPRLTAVRPIVSRHLGILRDAASIDRAIASLLPMAASDGADSDPALVALSIAVFARLREESRGAHARRDFPDAEPGSGRRMMSLAGIMETAHALTSFARSA